VTQHHPAKFSHPLIPIFQSLLPPDRYPLVLDPFAGTGRIHQLEQDTVGVELEPEWASMHPDTIEGNALKLPFDKDTFDAVCTSPTYGNRMADHHKAKDNSKRSTYRHALGRELTPNNSGAMQWGDEYREFHKRAWAEVDRVLKPKGRFVLNVKDHIRGGVRREVSYWHVAAITRSFSNSAKYSVTETIEVPLTGNGFGANGSARIPYEYVFCLDKKTAPNPAQQVFS
jgi:SAM-dependent methyltransferase